MTLQQTKKLLILSMMIATMSAWGRTRSTFDRWRKNGKISPADGHDPYPYWLESNVRQFIEQN